MHNQKQFGLQYGGFFFIPPIIEVEIEVKLNSHSAQTI
jgi:hypothetical protein